jgi:hypothetical protein
MVGDGVLMVMGWDEGRGIGGGSRGG